MVTAEGGGAATKEIYTLGTSVRTLEEFIALLRQVGVEVVADVRRFPKSRFEYFRKDNLAPALGKAGIDYVYLGDELGGYRKGDYEAFVTTEEFCSGLEMLEEIAGRGTTALMCAELLPWRCHRRFIGRELERRGWLVTHIIDAERSWVPKGG